MLIPEYKGYQGTFDYDQEDESFRGNAIAMRYGSLISFGGDTPKQVIENFQKAVDRHLESLAELQNKATESKYLDLQTIASLVENIKHKLVGVTQGPWRWADWYTPFGAEEKQENKWVLEFSPSRGDSRGSEVIERDDNCIKILEVEEPLDNDQDAYFIADARQDVETLVGIVEFLLNENQKLKGNKIHGSRK